MNLTTLLGYPPRTYEAFARETAMGSERARNSGKAHVLVPGGQMLIRHSTTRNPDYFASKE